MDWIIYNCSGPHQAVAVQGNRIIAVGTSGDVLPLRTAKTEVIDAKGQLLLPGFNDAHVHFLDGGFSLANVNLRHTRTPDEFVRTLREHVAKTPPGRLITGGEWDHENWPGAPLPHRSMVDSFTAQNPVMISRTDGHMALANSLALKLAGITRDTPDVPGGFIVRDANGEPTGVLKDAAMNAVWRIIPPVTTEDQRAAAQRASDYAASLGVTSVHDMLAGDALHIFRSLEECGSLKTRIYSMYPIARWEEAARADRGSAMALVRAGVVKGFSDGSLGSATAWFFDPYCDDPNNCGLPGDQMFPEGRMLERAIASDKAGLHIAMHAIGDRANAETLDIFAQLERTNGPRDRRCRIEHAQHLRASDIPRFARQRVIASIQPYHAVDDGRWCEPRLGPERLKTTYTFRSLLDSGATLALGTDWVVAPLDPLLTLDAAVHRRTLDGKHPNGWLPEQKLTMAEALHAYTVGSAYAEFAEHEKGTIAPGKLADLILLNQNILTHPEAITETRVTFTMMDGKVVHAVK